MLLDNRSRPVESRRFAPRGDTSSTMVSVATTPTQFFGRIVLPVNSKQADSFLAVIVCHRV